MTQLSLTPKDAEEAPDAGFRGPEVCKIAGVTYRQLDYWTRTGLVRASVAAARGSGTQRLFSYRDLVEVRVIKQLLDGGVSLQRARRAIEYLREHLGEELASANLVIDGSRSILATSDGEIVDLVRRGQGVFNVVPLSGLVEELDARIHELRPERAGAASAETGSNEPTSEPAEPTDRRASGGS